ncbi:MAG: hypothetical protein P8J32_07755 [bacterium]|nr:hypothetical protein [bacterium]
MGYSGRWKEPKSTCESRKIITLCQWNQSRASEKVPQDQERKEEVGEEKETNIGKNEGAGRYVGEKEGRGQRAETFGGVIETEREKVLQGQK